MSSNMINRDEGFQIAYEVSNGQYGKGIFTLQDIPAGAVIWKRGENNVRVFNSWEEVEARLQELPNDEARRYFASHVYCDPMMIEILDDGGLWNHSETPNTGGGQEPQHSYALRDIKAGEELFDDYGVYDYPEIYHKLQELWGENQDFIHIKPIGFSIDYEIKSAGDKGLGLFTKEFIPKGKEIWRSQSGKNMSMFLNESQFREYLSTLSNHVDRHNAVEFSYCCHGDMVMIILDDGKFMNHSDSPNTESTEVSVDRDCSVALRDIEAGEELTCDYRSFVFPEWYVRLHAEYDIPLDYFDLQIRSDNAL